MWLGILLTGRVDPGGAQWLQVFQESPSRLRPSAREVGIHPSSAAEEREPLLGPGTRSPVVRDPSLRSPWAVSGFCRIEGIQLHSHGGPGDGSHGFPPSAGRP